MRKRKWISCLLICAILSMYAPALPVYAAKKVKLAIYPLNTRRVNDDALIIAETALRNSISGADSFELLSNDEVKKKITSAGLAPVCDTNECLAEIAKTLGVELLVTGNISKMGAIYLIDLNLFDALAGQTINDAEMTCSLENEILTFALTSAGSNLVDVDRPEAVSAPPVVAVMPTKIETPAAEIIEEDLLAEPLPETSKSADTELLAKVAVIEEEVLEPQTDAEPEIVEEVIIEPEETIPPPEPEVEIAETVPAEETIAEVEPVEEPVVAEKVETMAAEPKPEIPEEVIIEPQKPVPLPAPVIAETQPEVVTPPEPGVAEVEVEEPVVSEKVEGLSADEIEEMIAEVEVQDVSEPVQEKPVAVEIDEDIVADEKIIDEPVREVKPVAEPGSYQKIIIFSSLGAVVVGGALAVTQISEANSNYVKESDEVEDSDEAKAFIAKAESASNLARAGIGVAVIGVSVAIYAYLKGGEPKTKKSATLLPKYIPELKIKSRNLSLSWRF